MADYSKFTKMNEGKGEFNPGSISDQAPSFLGYSRGIDAPNAERSVSALGTLFEGVGNIVKLVDEGTNNVIEESIRNEATEAYDRNTDLAIASLNGERYPYDSGNLPPDVVKGTEKAAAITEARAQGSMSDTHYNMLMDMEARRLRARYPGHRQQIDKIISNLTGNSSANEVRRSLMRDQAAVRSQDKDDREFREYVLKTVGNLPEDQSRENLERFFAQESAEKFRYEKEKRKLELQKQSGELDDRQAAITLDGLVNGTFSKFLSTAGNSLGKSAGDLRKLVSERAKTGVVPSSEDINQARVAWASTRSTVMAKTEKMLSDFAGTVRPEDRQKIREDVDKRLTSLGQDLENKHYGLLFDAEVRAKLEVDGAKIDLMNESDKAKYISAAKELYGPEVLNYTLSVFNPELLKELPIAKLNDSTNKVMVGKSQGQPTSVSKELQSWKTQKVTDPAAIDSFITRITDLTKNEEVQGEGWDNVFHALYSDDNSDFISQFKDSEKAKVYTRLANKSMADRVVAESANNPEYLSRYSKWTVNTFDEIVAKHIKEKAIDIEGEGKVAYNPANNSFSYVEGVREPFQLEGSLLNGQLLRSFRPNQEAAAQKLVADLNLAIQGLKPTVEAVGGDMNTVVQGFFKERNTTGLLRGISDAVSSANLVELETGSVKAAEAKQPEAPEIGMLPPEELKVVDVGEAVNNNQVGDLVENYSVGRLLDFIGSAESGGNYDMILGGENAGITNMTISEVFDLQKEMVKSGKESSAVGKYQFINKTLRRVVKKLGLDPDLTVMSPEVQDALALQLLKDRGLDKYNEGSLSAEQFGLALSKEWASLPKDAGGESSHEGVGSNRALRPWTALVSELDRVTRSNTSRMNLGGPLPSDEGPAVNKDVLLDIASQNLVESGKKDTIPNIARSLNKELGINITGEDFMKVINGTMSFEDMIKQQRKKKTR